jgi:hypothetical protein
MSAQVRRLLATHGGPFESFEVAETTTGNKRKAIVRFVEAASSVRAMAALHGQEQADLNRSPLYLTPFFTCKFTVLRGLWAVISTELDVFESRSGSGQQPAESALR